MQILSQIPVFQDKSIIILDLVIFSAYAIKDSNYFSYPPLGTCDIFESKIQFKDKSRNILDFVIFSAYELKT